MKPLVLFAVLLIQLHLGYAQATKILGTGVVFAKDEFKNIEVANTDDSPYLKINQTSGGEIKVNYEVPVKQSDLLNSLKTDYPYYFTEHNKYKTPLPKLSIRAFYPDENIVVFDAIKNKEVYRVFINGVWKVVKPTKGVEYQDWASYLKLIYVSINKEHPLYKESYTTSQKLSDNPAYSYKVVKVKGDWIKVQCSQECEGCPDNKVLRGWIQWKNKDKILVHLSYAC